SRVIQPKKLGALEMARHWRLADLRGISEEEAETEEDYAKRVLRSLWEQVSYKKIIGFVGNSPFVVEAAFTMDDEAEDTAEDEDRLCITTGINWSPALCGIIPFHDLDWLLNEQRVYTHDPVSLVVHVVFPQMRPTDRSKSRYSLPDGIRDALEK